MLRRFALLASAASLLIPATAQAVTPGAATVGADSRATFNWTNDAGETSPSVSVSKTATVDASGGLSSLFEYQWFEGGASTWTTDDPLHAGTYYWQAAAYNAEFNKVVAAPQALVVPPVFTPARATFTCVGRKRLALRSGWMTNVPDLNYTVKVSQGKRVLANLKYTEYLSTSKINTSIREDHDWTPMFASNFPKGATFRAAVRVTGPGVNFVKTLTARCR